MKNKCIFFSEILIKKNYSTSCLILSIKVIKVSRLQSRLPILSALIIKVKKLIKKTELLIY